MQSYNNNFKILCYDSLIQVILHATFSLAYSFVTDRKAYRACTAGGPSTIHHNNPLLLNCVMLYNYTRFNSAFQSNQCGWFIGLLQSYILFSMSVKSFRGATIILTLVNCCGGEFRSSFGLRNGEWWETNAFLLVMFKAVPVGDGCDQNQ